ncbi:MAG: glycine reductase [Betaproteobacteria bacterium]|nr:MAG: glycine reductase [Betaproteobacteria bacterium]
MTSERGRQFDFAVAHDAPIPYLQRIRDYYQALGYGAPYEWAHYSEVPFRPLDKPLSKSRITIITTATPYQPDKGDQGPRAPYNAAAKFYTVYSGNTAQDHDLRISHIAIDRKHTTAEDSAAYFPLTELRQRAASGRIGSVAARFHGAPTNRSHRVTLQVDCPEIVARCRADEVDAAILVPNCPICHQTVSLAARMLEENGISTIVMGCAKDIVEYVGVPRFLFSDFPLGNAAGRPNDPVSQAFTFDLALSVLETAPAPRATVQSPLAWTASPDWKLDYCNIERLAPEEIRRRRAEFDEGKAQARRAREEAGITQSTAEDEIA